MEELHVGGTKAAFTKYVKDTNVRAIHAYRHDQAYTARSWETTGSKYFHPSSRAIQNTGKEGTGVQNGTRSRDSCQSKQIE